MIHQIVCTPEELRDEKQRSHAEGVRAGHQAANKFLQSLLSNPTLTVHFGNGFPDDLRKTINDVVLRLREHESCLPKSAGEKS
jgi:hypothetical protein